MPASLSIKEDMGESSVTSNTSGLCYRHGCTRHKDMCEAGCCIKQKMILIQCKGIIDRENIHKGTKKKKSREP